MLARTIAVPIGRPSFLGARHVALPDLPPGPAGSLSPPPDVAVIGIPHPTPHDLESSRAACAEAPAAVRAQSLGLAERAGHYDFDLGGELWAGRTVEVVDAGDVAARPGRYAENAARAEACVRLVVERGAIPVVLGGDHAAAIPALAAVAARGPVGVLHLGAGLDWEEAVDGVSDGPRSAMRRAAALAGVAGMAQVGLRGAVSARPADVDAARRAGSVLVTAREVHARGIDRVLERLPACPRYYVSLDVGALDPGIAPGVERPAFGGLTYYQVTALLLGLATRGPIAGLDLVGIAPSRDLHDRTSLLGARLVLNVLGALAHAGRLGRAPGPRLSESRPAGRRATVLPAPAPVPA